ncbi:MAG TPA: alpha/beta hydrolase fold domain-containing protein [Steroidobacteraceae bacterium]|nr:alpha/beta hydrolase fold domain-containing protein [Steroidobacteraceae bacterium]
MSDAGDACRDEALAAADGIDPDIRRFVSRVNADYARLTAGRELPVIEMRAVAEQVRAPWREGGPVMRSTAERVLDTDAGAVRVRLYDPGVAERPAPALVYMHGGGWTLFSLDTHDRVMREYAARAGALVVGVDYALAPEAQFPVALNQVVGVVRWLHEHGATLGVDAGRIALGGDSAGGNLSICSAIALRDTGQADYVHGLLLIYPAFDKHCSSEAMRRFGGPGAVLTAEEVEYFWNNYTGGADLRNEPLAMPLRARLEGLPPMCLTIPECDVLTEQSHQMAARLRAAGVPVALNVYAGATHSFIEAVSIAPVADRAIGDGARWLRDTLHVADDAVRAK